MVFRKSRRKKELKEDVIIDNVKLDFVPGSHTRSASYFWISCAIHQRKEYKGHWYFVQSKKGSQRKFNENTILCFYIYISIFHLLYYSLGQHCQLSPRASDCATKTCNKDGMCSTEIWPYLPIIPTIYNSASQKLICILCPALPLHILQTIPSEYFFLVSSP